MTTDVGRCPDGPGYSPKGAAASSTASPAKPSIPNAEWPREVGDEFMRAMGKELPEGFKRWWLKWGDTVRFWRVKSLARTAYEDGFEIGARAALQTLYEVDVLARREAGDAQ